MFCIVAHFINCKVLNVIYYFKRSIIVNNFILFQSCGATGGMCNTIISGYYAEIAISTVLGVAWYLTIKKPIAKLQSSDEKNWLISEEQNLVMESI